MSIARPLQKWKLIFKTFLSFHSVFGSDMSARVMKCGGHVGRVPGKAYEMKCEGNEGISNTSTSLAVSLSFTLAND